MPYASKSAQRAAEARWKRTPKGRFANHKQHARSRGVPFLLTFDEWWGLWAPYFDERGNDSPDAYVMSRHGDEGPYALGNVSIKRHRENVAERNSLFAKARRQRGLTADDFEVWIDGEFRRMVPGYDVECGF
ncbi:MAG: hypothetical protein ACREXP_00195 [Steroidobacteraceae bacterium]